MSLRQSFSRFRKKAKDKASDIRNRIKRQATCVGGEGLDHSTLYLQSEPAIVAGGELGRATGVGVGNDDPRPGSSMPVSRSMTELERKPGGSESSQERAGADRKRVGQVDPPRSESDIGRTPTPSILQDGEPEST